MKYYFPSTDCQSQLSGVRDAQFWSCSCEQRLCTKNSLRGVSRKYIPGHSPSWERKTHCLRCFAWIQIWRGIQHYFRSWREKEGEKSLLSDVAWHFVVADTLENTGSVSTPIKLWDTVVKSCSRNPKSWLSTPVFTVSEGLEEPHTLGLSHSSMGER